LHHANTRFPKTSIMLKARPLMLDEEVERIESLITEGKTKS